jgi:glycosyltransferase involved in cell wall biosynthesis
VKPNTGSRRGKAGHSSREGILIISQYDLPEHKRNMNAYQRIIYGSRYAPVALLVRRNQAVSDEIKARADVHWAPVSNRWLFFLYAVFFALAVRRQKYAFILTEPSGFAGVGFLAKLLGGYFWVMDVWDRPRWRGGLHEGDNPAKMTDRFVFWIMRFADLYLLSVLPRAAKDIRMNSKKCIQLYNAIDLTAMATAPPERSERDPVLHVGYGKSKFSWTEGLHVVIKAAEILKLRKCPVLIHLIGKIPNSEIVAITTSPAADLLKVHGFVSMTRIDFFRQMHAGLVAYEAYEDLSYIFPIKVLEHLSQGNPVIVSRLPGLCAMVQHEYNGLVVEPGNPQSLADAIARLQVDPVLLRKLATNAIDSVKCFDVNEKNRKIFTAILSRGVTTS